MADSKELQDLQKRRAEQKALLDESLKGKADEERLLIKQDTKYKKRVQILKEINAQIQEIRDNNKIIIDTLISQESKMKSFSGLQKLLADTDKKRIKSQQSLDANIQSSINSIASMNQDLLAMSKEEIISRQNQEKLIESALYDLIGMEGITDDIVENLMKQYDISSNISKLTTKQQDFLEKQRDVYDDIKDTIGGVLETADLLMSTTGGKIGAIMMGAGKAIGMAGENARLMGGYLGGATVSATALSTIFPNAADSVKSLSSELGGLNDVTFGTQLNTNLMATNMGITVDEAAKLTGNFARLNGNSTDTAANLAQSTKELALQNGLVPSTVMADVAASSLAFAEYGKDGGKNIAEAAVAAGKLGVTMDNLTNVTDSLLDFETSINAELELGAMLGRNINLDRARALAYEGNIGGAVKETLSSLGGIDAFNKMDIFQKRKAAELLGLSVDEFQKMAANSDKLNADGTLQLSTFESWSESLKAFASGPLGSVASTMGSLVIGAGQLGTGFSTLSGPLGGILEKLRSIGSTDALSTVVETAESSLADKAKDAISEKASGKAEEFLDSKIDSVISPEGIEETTESINADKSMGDKLKDLSKGLKAMGDGKVLFGALNLIPTAFGFVSILAGIPGMMAISSLGVPTSVGLKALAKGLTSFGKAGLAALQGIGLLALFGIALIPLTYALSLLAPVIESIGKAIGSMVTSLSTGISAIITSIGDAMVKLVPLMNLENAAGILAMAGAISILAGSLAALGTFGVTGLAVLAGVAVAGVAIGGVADALGFSGGDGNVDKTDMLIEEIKGLRADLNSGKIAVYMDGKKVTSGVAKVVNTTSTNSYVPK
jgi:hypothetical protein